MKREKNIFQGVSCVVEEVNCHLGDVGTDYMMILKLILM